MNIVFLDFDGVLNTPRTWTRPTHRAIERPLVRRVSDLCDATDARIVISSAWRLHQSVATLQTILGRHGLNPTRVIDRTPWLPHQPRQDEILQWLRQTRHAVARFVALDDDTAGDRQWEKIAAQFVQIDFRYGVQPADIKRATQILTAATRRVA